MNITATVVFGILGLIAIADVLLIVKKGKTATISAWIIRHSKEFPVFPFLIGFAMGHLFWQMKPLDVYECDSREIKEVLLTCSE